MANAVVLAKAVPPVAAAYHCKPVPVATKSATVALLQNVCADAVGAVVVFTVTVVLALLEHPAAVVAVAV